MSSAQAIIYAGSTEYGDYRIVDMTYEGRPARVLFSNENAGQSGLALDDDPELLFDYNQRFLEIVESTKPKNVLIIGGGAFTLPTALINRFPDITVDVVEIDPTLYDLAQRYFEAPAPGRLRVFNQDGRSYIDTATNHYDCVILDAFNGYTIPHSLITQEAATRYAAILTPNGLIAVNFIASYRSLHETLTHRLMATFATAFRLTHIYPADRGYWTHAEQNLLLVGMQTEQSLDYLQSAEASVSLIADVAVLSDDDPDD